MIYFDNAATTRCSEETAETLVRFARESYFNPSSAYREGIAAKNEIERARARLIKSMRGGEGKLVFTSGGTESDNLAHYGSRKPNKSRVIISSAEHAAVYYAAMELRRRGFDVCLCPVDPSGRINEEAFQELMTADTSFVSVIHVNNETGAINDIKKLTEIAKAVNPDVIFHSDGVQAFGKIPVSLSELGVDLYSLSAHKLNAPKGTGALFIKKGLSLNPILFGGGQEGGLRSSTENVGGIISFADSGEYYTGHLAELSSNARQIKQKIKASLHEIGDFLIITDKNSSDYILSFASSKVRGEVIQHALEREGILVGTGSACSSSRASRRVAEAIGLSGKYIEGIVRLSFGRYNDIGEAEVFASVFKKIYKELSEYGN